MALPSLTPLQALVGGRPPSLPEFSGQIVN